MCSCIKFQEINVPLLSRGYRHVPHKLCPHSFFAPLFSRRNPGKHYIFTKHGILRNTPSEVPLCMTSHGADDIADYTLVDCTRNTQKHITMATPAWRHSKVMGRREGGIPRVRETCGWARLFTRPVWPSTIRIQLNRPDNDKQTTDSWRRECPHQVLGLIVWKLLKSLIY